MAEKLFEDRSTYDPAKDAVSVCTLTVECNPGQAASVRAFMAGVISQAGVYHASFDSSLIEPAAAPAAEPELAKADVAETSSSVTAVADEQGDTHGEQSLESTNSDSAGADERGQGSDATQGGTTYGRPEHAESELAGTAGEAGAGSIGRDA